MYRPRKMALIEQTEYLKPLFKVVYDVFSVRLDRNHPAKYKKMPRMIIIHILYNYIELPYTEINKILRITNASHQAQMYKEHPKNNLLTNISYAIYQDYINELKKLDLEIIK